MASLRTAVDQLEARYRLITEVLPYMVWSMRPDLTLEFLNERSSAYTGLTVDEVNDGGWGRLVHPDDLPGMLATVSGMLERGEAHTVEYRFLRHDGEYRWVESTAYPLKDAGGQVQVWIGATQDIHDRRLHEQQLAASEARFRQLANAMPQIVWTSDAAGNVDFRNQRWFENTGLSSPVEADVWKKLVHPEDFEIRTAWVESLRDGKPFGHEFRLRNVNTNEYRWFLSRAEPIRDESGKVVRWFGTSTDIDDQKKVEQRLAASEQKYRDLAETLEARVAERSAAAEQRAHDLAASERQLQLALEKLRDSEERFRTAFDLALIGKGLVAPDGRYLRVNRAFCEIVGYSESELLERSFQSITHPDDLRADLKYVAQMLAGEIPSYQMEKRYFHKDGRIVNVLLSVALVRDADGKPLHFIGQVQDLTRLKAAEEERRQAALRAQLVEPIMAAREDEQRRIARDLHDGLGQSLTSIRLGLRAIEEAVELDTTRASAAELRRIVAAAIDEVRSMAKSLRPRVLDDLGLIPAVARLISDFTLANELKIRFDAATVEGMRFPEVVETGVFRIVQEALTNVIKHARAMTVAIELHRDDVGLRLTVRDNGIGFGGVASADDARSFGIAGMRERATLLGGDFELTAGKTGGTTILVSIPLPQEVAVGG